MVFKSSPPPSDLDVQHEAFICSPFGSSPTKLNADGLCFRFLVEATYDYELIDALSELSLPSCFHLTSELPTRQVRQVFHKNGVSWGFSMIDIVLCL